MKIRPFLPWSQLMENNKPRWTNLQERLFLFPLPLRGTVLPCQGPWVKTVNLNSHWLPELFSTALPTTHLGLLPRPLAAGDLHQLLLLREGSVCGLCSSSWSFSLDLADCMQISVNTAICPLSLPTTAESGLRETVLAQASHSACHLSVPLGWVTHRMNPRRRRTQRAWALVSGAKINTLSEFDMKINKLS